QRRADARARLCVRGPLADRGGADLRVSPAQRARTAARDAARRRDQGPEQGRDRGARRRLQPLFVGDLARLAVLGDQGGLRAPAHPAGREARAQALAFWERPMKLASYLVDGKPAYGVVVDDGVVTMSGRLRYSSLREALAAGALGELRKAAESARA